MRKIRNDEKKKEKNVNITTQAKKIKVLQNAGYNVQC